METKKGWVAAGQEVGLSRLTGDQAGSGGLVRPGALKKEEPYGRGLHHSPEWPQGQETQGSDPCNPSVITQLCHLSSREGDLESPEL